MFDYRGFSACIQKFTFRSLFLVIQYIRVMLFKYNVRMCVHIRTYICMHTCMEYLQFCVYSTYVGVHLCMHVYVQCSK